MNHFHLIIILMLVFLYLAFLPIVISFINNYGIPAVATFNADQPTKDLLISLMQLLPTAILIMIVVSGLFYAIPRPER